MRTNDSKTSVDSKLEEMEEKYPVEQIAVKNEKKSLMKTRKQKETGEKEVHLLEQKGYERMMNEIMPVQQAEVYRKPTKKVVEEAVKELNPDTNSLGSRG